MFRDVAAKMVPNGWHNIIPLTIDTGQKKPAVKWAEYQRADIPLETLRSWYQHRRLGAMPLTGMVFGEHRRIVALDIDVTDEALNRQIIVAGHDLGIGSEYWRVGNAPKVMAFFKGSVRSQKMNGVEVFGSSGQVAIFGTHPTTGKEYQWPSKSLLDARPDDLPEITQEQVDAWTARIAPLLGERAGVTGRGVIPSWVKETLRKDGIDGAHRLVLGLTDGTRHPVLLGVTGWLVSQGHSVESIVTFIDNNFPNHLRRDDWRKLRPRVGQMASDAVEKFFGEEDW